LWEPGSIAAWLEGETYKYHYLATGKDFLATKNRFIPEDKHNPREGKATSKESYGCLPPKLGKQGKPRERVE